MIAGFSLMHGPKSKQLASDEPSDKPSDKPSALGTLISAYSQIAEVFPRFDHLGRIFKDSQVFQHVLAVVYSDILEFHQHAYKFFRRLGKPFLLNASAPLDSKRRRMELLLRFLVGPLQATLQRHPAKPLEAPRSN